MGPHPCERHHRALAAIIEALADGNLVVTRSDVPTLVTGDRLC
jgi:hypothetical protein